MLYANAPVPPNNDSNINLYVHRKNPALFFFGFGVGGGGGGAAASAYALRNDCRKTGFDPEFALNGCANRTACRCDRVVSDRRESIDSCMVDRENISARERDVLAAIIVVAQRRLRGETNVYGCPA